MNLPSELSIGGVLVPPLLVAAILGVFAAGVVARIAGPVVEVGIKSHQMVKKGDLLYRIDPVPFEGEVHLAHAALDQTLADLEVLDSQVEAAEAAVRTAEAQIATASVSVFPEGS